MNEKLQYATMLEIPVSTCSVTTISSRKRKPKKKKVTSHEQVKEQLVNKVNSEVNEESAKLYEGYSENTYGSLEQTENVQEENYAQTQEQEYETEKPIKESKKFSVIGVQLAIVFALITAIFLTNAFYPDSGINVFMREVFGGNSISTVTPDERTYDEFAPVVALSNGATALVENGVINLSGEGSIYAPCNGKITAISSGEDGKFTIEVSHSENFKTVLSGVDYAYVELNDQVYFNIPVGYTQSGQVKMCFTDEQGVTITNYQLIENTVVWAV